MIIFPSRKNYNYPADVKNYFVWKLSLFSNKQKITELWTTVSPGGEMGNSQKLFDIQNIFNLHTILLVKKLPFFNTEETGIYAELMDFLN